MQIPPPSVQVEYRIADQLSRSMQRHVAAALDLEDLQAVLRQHAARERKARGLGAAPQRHDRLVLHQEQQVLRQLTGTPAAAELALQLQHFTVAAAAQLQ